MKVKTISRSDNQFLRSSSHSKHKIQRNAHPTQHLHEQAREYTRALNASKLKQLFAKPFIASLDSHMDGVYSLAKHSNGRLASGSGDGEIYIHNVVTKEKIWSVHAHNQLIKGLTWDGERLLSCAENTVKVWNTSTLPIQVYTSKSNLNGLDHHYSLRQFATAGTSVELWDDTRTESIAQMSWDTDSIQSVKFNPVETHVLASCGSDRTICLYDIRMNTPISQVVLAMRTNSLCWNPQEPFNFAAANEDHNVYLFDMRKLQKARHVFKDHVSAVMDVDYSPTGLELVSGGYDKTVRIFADGRPTSRDVYHTKRMQRVFAVKWSVDDLMIFSGSEDGNVRLWKARASESLGVVRFFQKKLLNEV
jgi:WD repeat and SOF domain-containing protein 1